MISDQIPPDLAIAKRRLITLDQMYPGQNTQAESGRRYLAELGSHLPFRQSEVPVILQDRQNLILGHGRYVYP